MSSIFAEVPIIRGRKKSRTGNLVDQTTCSIHRDKPEEEPSLLRHLVANGAPQNPNFDEVTDYYAERIVETGQRPPSRQGFREPFDLYITWGSLALLEPDENIFHERLEDFPEVRPSDPFAYSKINEMQDEFENPFFSVLDAEIDQKSLDSTYSQSSKRDPYIPPQLSSPNFTFPASSLPPPLAKHEGLFLDAETRDLLHQADLLCADYLVRANLGAQQQRIPTRKVAPGVIGPPGKKRDGGHGAIQRPAPAAPQQDRHPRASVVAPPPVAPPAEPLTPPGLGPLPNTHKNSSVVPPIAPYIPVEIYAGLSSDTLNVYLEAVRVMFREHHRIRAARTGASLKHCTVGSSTAAVVPTQFNPIRAVACADVWLNVVADHLDRLRVGKRTSRPNKKPHYLSLMFASHAGVVRPPRVPSPFLNRICD